MSQTLQPHWEVNSKQMYQHVLYASSGTNSVKYGENVSHYLHIQQQFLTFS